MCNVKQDIDYLNKYINAFDILWQSTKNLIGFIKDQNFTYLSFSDEFQRISHAHDFKVMIGKNDFDAIQGIKSNDSINSMIQNARKHDELIKLNKCSRSYLYVTDDDKLYVAQKHPIINPETNNFLGVRAEMSPFLYPHILKTIYNMNGVENEILDLHVDDEISNYRLTDRQQMILYLYLQRYSCAAIAEQLTLLGYGISRERVNDYLSNLKNIFKVKNKDDLIKKAIAMSYDMRIPRKLIKQGIHEITGQFLTC